MVSVEVSYISDVLQITKRRLFQPYFWMLKKDLDSHHVSRLILEQRM